MKNENRESDNKNEQDIQKAKDIKGNMPIKNAMTDDIKNSVSEILPLNKTKTTRDDLFPSDGDNLTGID